jgi:hypothetical protein
MSDLKEIRTAADADAIREDIEAIFDGWFADEERIDWENFLDRVENLDYDLGNDTLSPAIKRIKAIVRELRKQLQ